MKYITIATALLLSSSAATRLNQRFADGFGDNENLSFYNGIKIKGSDISPPKPPVNAEVIQNKQNHQ